MTAGVLDHGPPANSCDIAGVTGARDIASIVCVNTQPLGPHASTWPRESFFVWFEAAKKAAGIVLDSDVAKAAGLSHTTISAWRHGKQRPSIWPLSAIARVLKTKARVAWAQAGLLTEDDLREAMTPEELDGLDLIEASPLSRDAKDKLKAIHLAQVARDREDALRRVREQIDLMDRD